MAVPTLAELDEQAPIPSGTSSGEPGGEEESSAPAMTVVEHLEELRKRLFICLLALALASVVGFVFWQPVMAFLLTPLPHLSNGLLHNGQLFAKDVGEPFMVALKLSVALGVLGALPVVLYETWAYIAPGLTRRERRYALPFTLLGVALFAIGLTLGFIVLRYPLAWLFDFGGDRFVIVPDAESYFTFVAFFLLAFGLVFELPLVLTLLAVVGLVKSRFLRQKRMYILFGLWFLSCFVTPGADPFSPVIIGVSFTVLFELSLLLMRALGK